MANAVMRPMLATAGPLPAGPQWAFEFVWDGIRSLADVQPGRVRLLNAQPTSYPEIDVLAGRRRMLLDGKLVALDACGRPSFARLQRRRNVARPSDGLLRRVPVAYYVFDILRLDDRSTLQLPYRQRRELLEELGLAAGPMVLPPSFLDTDGQAVLDTAAQYALHGVIAKRADSTYQPGRRSRSWVETALRHTQEVIIGGWVPGTRGLASLLVGVPTERGLRYAGRVGTGFTQAMRGELLALLTGLEQRTSPFVDDVPPARWVAPQLLGEVSYRRWTPDGRLGHPTWRGLRPGKHPAAVRAPVLLGATPDAADQHELDEAVARARAEVAALRARISPHFLSNAVSAIAALVRTDPARARELLHDFAHFTRYSLRCFEGEAPGTVADEVDHVERYLALQQARFGDRLRVRTRIAPDVLGVALPFLAVQRLVENAVERIEDEPLGGTVTLWAVTDGDHCLITVTDDASTATAEPGEGTTVSLRIPRAASGPAPGSRGGV